jgi:DNA-binding FadR family transcriptional regulator
MKSNPDPRPDGIAGGLYNDILAGILLGEYPPQSTLPTETRLARDYGVSRTVVRSALELLKREGIVRSRQGSGTVVAAHDPYKMALLNRNAQLEQLEQCFACRLAIEPEIAATVCQNLTNEARRYLKDQLIELETGETIDKTESYRAAQDADFHIRLAELSGNVFFASIMNSLRPHMLFAMNVVKVLAPRDQNAHVSQSRIEHLNIVQALLDENPPLAHRAMRAHLESGRSRIFQKS